MLQGEMSRLGAMLADLGQREDAVQPNLGSLRLASRVDASDGINVLSDARFSFKVLRQPLSVVVKVVCCPMAVQ